MIYHTSLRNIQLWPTPEEICLPSKLLVKLHLSRPTEGEILLSFSFLAEDLGLGILSV